MLSLDESKIISMVALGLSSFLVGILPLKFSSHGRQRYPLLITVLLCFGGGVLLATSIIHMLPEVREQIPEYAELLFCVGFFIVYLVDELVHFFCGETIGHNHHREEHTSLRHGDDTYSQVQNHQPIYGHELTEQEVNPSSPSCCPGESSNARICHVNHTEPCNSSATGRAGLLIALSLHAILEGLAIGLQESASKVILLMSAVASHKLVVGFCLGLELSANTVGKACATVTAMLIFSLGSVVGIGAGMAIADHSENLHSVLPIMQALAGGTLLYVTVCEVLPRERSRWHQKRSCPSAGLIQFAAVSVGFTAMTLLNIYLGE
ncbi:zinc transporter ZIP3 isoform X2 [Ctenocephalides felis]|uniref:zinc transporter ZIP3 isoform X2 n=1 Tax=Ctenocephalides felis TaxID=7515 RepID=UPI000E6E2E4D|nr:zinc transporter ZIP3 isoform X2 [Ctenocephalides felis]